ncbi:MAG TPA: ribonuclease P protein component [Accumulibacter sp.]|jgi:ribonuclease P protein component|nr:ribonuclease P protein component [Accumulibacter sp.]
MVEAAVESRRYPQAARLRQPSQFKALAASSKRLRGAKFELRFRANDAATARLGLVIPKRLARRSVLRNLIKRLVRESFRARLPSLPRVDIVIRLSNPISLGMREDRRQQRRQWRADIDALLTGVTG